MKAHRGARVRLKRGYATQLDQPIGVVYRLTGIVGGSWFAVPEEGSPGAVPVSGAENAFQVLREIPDLPGAVKRVQAYLDAWMAQRDAYLQHPTDISRLRDLDGPVLTLHDLQQLVDHVRRSP